MGRKAHPTALRLIKGNPSKKPLNALEPMPPPGRPEPPDHLTAEAKAEWERAVGDLYSVGIMTIIDRAAFAAYCSAWGLWVEIERELAIERAKAYKGQSSLANEWRLVGMANRAKADVMRYAAEFGMTPSARSRIKATPPKPEDAAQRYLA